MKNFCAALFLAFLSFFNLQEVQAASRYLTCTTACTITAADQTIWCSDAARTTCTVSVPTTTDDVILDGATCVGGTTCTATFGAGYNPTWISFTMTLCTASTSGCIVEANTNGNTINLTGNFVNSGSGNRTVSGGTWILSSASASWNTAASGTITNSPSINFSNSSGAGRSFTGGGKTYGTLTIGTAGSNAGSFTFQSGNNTFSTLTINAPNRIAINNSTNTVTTMTDVTGNSSQQVLIGSFNGISTFSSANNWTCTWCGIQGYTFSGGGTFSAPNSFNFGGNTGITITTPSGGGGSGHIIGG